MAAITYLASMALMALLVLVVAGAIAGRGWREYTPTIRPEGGSALSNAATSESVWTAAFILAALVVGGGAWLFVSGDSYSTALAQAAGVAVAAGLLLTFTFYIFYGSYRAAKARGLQKAAAVMAGAWVLGIVAVIAIAVKLLF